MRRYNENNKEVVAASKRAWKLANPEKVKESQKRECPKRRRGYVKAWEERNAEYVRGLARDWSKTTKGKAANAVKAARRRMLSRCQWADQELIAQIYQFARVLSDATGIVYHVDHVVPIKNRHVCGLHNQFNLQVIPASENLKKHNKFTPSWEKI